MRELLPPLRRSPSLEEGGLGLGKSKVSRISTRPYNVAENCNCEMYLQRWAASLQRLDAFATDGCIAIPCRGARRVIGATAKPIYPIDGKAVGLDRRIPPDLPLRGRGTAPWAVEGVRRRWKASQRITTPNTNGRANARPSCLKAIYLKAASPYFFPIKPSYSASVFACTFSAMALLASVAAACLACVVSAAATAAFMVSKSAKISC